MAALATGAPATEEERQPFEMDINAQVFGSHMNDDANNFRERGTLFDTNPPSPSGFYTRDVNLSRPALNDIGSRLSRQGYRNDSSTFTCPLASSGGQAWNPNFVYRHDCVQAGCFANMQIIQRAELANSLTGFYIGERRGGASAFNTDETKLAASLFQADGNNVRSTYQFPLDPNVNQNLTASGRPPEAIGRNATNDIDLNTMTAIFEAYSNVCWTRGSAARQAGKDIIARAQEQGIYG